MPLIQSYDWRPCQAGTADVWCEQIHENAYLQFGLGFASYSSKAPFYPSMMVHFRKRFSEDELSWIKELIAERGKAMVMEAVEARQDEDDSDDPDANAATSSQSMIL